MELTLSEADTDNIVLADDCPCRLNEPNELGVRTFNSQEELTVETVKQLLDDE